MVALGTAVSMADSLKQIRDKKMMINELSSVKKQGISVGAIHESSRTIDLVFLMSVNIFSFQYYIENPYLLSMFSLQHSGIPNCSGGRFMNRPYRFLHFACLVYSPVNQYLHKKYEIRDMLYGYIIPYSGAGCKISLEKIGFGQAGRWEMRYNTGIRSEIYLL